MSTPGEEPRKTLDECATLRARVVEFERENDLLKQAQGAHTEAGGGLQTSGTPAGTPELGSLQRIYRAAPIGLCHLDMKLRYVFVNEWLAEINGLSVEQHLGRSISEVLPDVAAGVEAQLRGVIETGEPVVGGTVKAETAAQPGVKKYFEHHYHAVRSADGAIVGVSCVVQDITARKQAEESLRESEGRMRALLEGAFEGIIISDKGTILEANQAFADMYGYALEEVIGLSPLELTTPESAAKIAERIAKGDETPYEIVGLKRDGTAFDLEVVGKNCTYHGRDARISAMRDITERKRAEEALQESESKYRGLFESASDVILLVDGKGNIVDINRRGELLTGYSRAELCAMNVLRQLVVPEDRDIPRQILARAAPGEEPVYEVRWRTKDGRTIHFEGVTTFLFLPTGGFLSTRCTLRDITERKRAEEQARRLQADLAHMSRLSSMGEMATGLAHELNQPLTVITNYAQGCVRRLKSNTISQDELENILSRIATQARRSGSIIRSLGNFVRKSSALRTNIDVNQSIMDVAELVNAEAAQHRVKARFELEPNLPPVKVDQTQLQQVILNLVQNGCEAIEDAPESRREVTVRTKQRDDSYLEIVVSDCGAGIPEALGERLFEPFVTTKVHGIGMGLAISRSIVESHGGRLWATPNPDQGTTFHFTLAIVGGGGGDE